MKYILPFFLCLCSIGSVHSQGIDTLDTLLLNAYKSNDSSEYYFSKSKKLLKNKADTANYWYFRFFRNDVQRITDSTAYYSNKVIPLLKSLDSLERI